MRRRCATRCPRPLVDLARPAVPPSAEAERWRRRTRTGFSLFECLRHSSPPHTPRMSASPTVAWCLWGDRCGSVAAEVQILWDRRVIPNDRWFHAAVPLPPGLSQLPSGPPGLGQLPSVLLGSGQLLSGPGVAGAGRQPVAVRRARAKRLRWAADSSSRLNQATSLSSPSAGAGSPSTMMAS